MRCAETLQSVSRLPDEALCVALARLAGCERCTTASMIAHLVEFDARRLHLSAGFRSLFRYCTDRLRLSEHAAYNRIEAVHVARRFPEVLDRIEEGSLNLTTVRLLASHLTEDNREDLLASAAFKSKGDVEELIARLPRPDVQATIRKLPTPAKATVSTPISTAPSGSSKPDGEARQRAAGPEDAGATWVARPSVPGVPEDAGRFVVQPSPRRDVVRPLAADRYEIRFTATAATREKLRLATDLLRHVVPNGDLSEIVDRALTALLDDVVRRKFAVVTRGRERDSPTAESGSEEYDAGPRDSHARLRGKRHIPAAIKRAVWLRDSGRCAFVARNGRRCDAGALIELHHVDPYAVGGAATVDNIQLRCRAHNAYEADLFYGQREPTGVQTPRQRCCGDGTQR